MFHNLSSILILYSALNTVYLRAVSSPIKRKRFLFSTEPISCNIFCLAFEKGSRLAVFQLLWSQTSGLRLVVRITGHLTCELTAINHRGVKLGGKALKRMGSWIIQSPPRIMMTSLRRGFELVAEWSGVEFFPQTKMKHVQWTGCSKIAIW